MVNTSIPISSSLQVAANILATIKNGNIQAQILNGVVNPVPPDLSSGTLLGLLAKGVGNEIGSTNANTLTALNQQMPDTSTGAFLDRWLDIYDEDRRLAGPSTGAVISSTSPTTATTFVPSGVLLTSATGIRFMVAVGGTYGNGSTIPVISVDVGTQCNFEAGTVLTWTTPPANFAPNTVVSTTSPLEGGTDAESDGVARARLFAFFANPPTSGNPKALIDVALSSSNAVQAAYVHPAIRGPASVDITVVGYGTTTSSSRQMDPTLLANTISPAILGSIPSGYDGYVANCSNTPIDISLTLSLPYPATAQPAGPGGGWLDPNPIGITASCPMVQIINGYALSSNDPSIPQNTPNSFWINCPVPLLQGTQYNISYLSPTDLTLYSATTAPTFTPAFGALSSYTTLYYVTINNPFYDNALLGTTPLDGSAVFPTAVNTATYVDAFITYMLSMGPGERMNTLLNTRATRVPLEALSGNYIINDRVVKPIIDSGPEVYDGAVFYFGRNTSGSTLLPNGTGLIAPGITSFTPWSGIGAVVGQSNTAYAIGAPPTAYEYYNTALCPTNIFSMYNFGIYKQ